MSMTMPRNNFLDAVRGFGIVLVVIGHLIQMRYLPDSFDSNIIFKLIYSFHMALFFLISGYFFKEKSLFDEMIWSTKRLIVPFFSFYFLVSCKADVRQFFSTIVDYVINPQIGFWFFFVLFSIRIFVTALLECKWVFKGGVLIFVSLILAKMHTIASAHYILFYTPFFLLGYWVRVYGDALVVVKAKDVIQKNILLFLIVTSIIYLGIFSLFYTRTTVGNYSGLFLIQKSVLALLGSVIVIMFFGLIYKYIKIPLLEYVGRFTLSIYGLHLLFIFSYDLIGWGALIFMILIPVLVSEAYSRLLRSTKSLAFLSR
ncbi:acyltransferase family protein [Pseudogulbenkiania ferrooxidans]|uniref:acyltransferase family protein n=1 Tax=Pseudogulbenkiania ferrooxidans TaxID=549169 RepID=UPI001377FC58|nr:acyltransferase family protein [Pseudogulbenkiania ferrooxidans]